jgi:hypothetical protein
MRRPFDGSGRSGIDITVPQLRICIRSAMLDPAARIATTSRRWSDGASFRVCCATPPIVISTWAIDFRFLTKKSLLFLADYPFWRQAALTHNHSTLGRAGYLT